MSKNLGRNQYNKGQLRKADLDQDPFAQFDQWMKEAIDSEALEPNAAVLSTVSADRKPSSRVVLLKQWNHSVIRFFTNYESAKAKDIQANANVGINLFWPYLERQIRIEGTISKAEENVSDDYFASRPRESQLGAWVSGQSKIIESREILESNFETMRASYEGKDIPRPTFWGGYEIMPCRFEFWQGRPSRLNDRIVYTYEESTWQKTRLSP